MELATAWLSYCLLCHKKEKCSPVESASIPKARKCVTTFSNNSKNRLFEYKNLLTLYEMEQGTVQGTGLTLCRNFHIAVETAVQRKDKYIKTSCKVPGSVTKIGLEPINP